MGCSSQRDNAVNRSLQNLSARYNFIYNSNVLLSAYQDGLTHNNNDNYDHLLPVYIAPGTADFMGNTASPNKILDEISRKAETIIAEKGLSNYLDESYILLAKTNFYKGNYFSAAAYFDYAAKAFSKDRNVYLTALNWKARSLMELHDNAAATKVLDTAEYFLDSVKTGKAEPLATLAQMSIYREDFQKAISYLTRATEERAAAQEKIRWSYILAQLYENAKQYELSLANYAKVERSNAPFEMYFNAKLSKIRIDDLTSNHPSNRQQQLLKLLKDDKNFDYADRIYYQVGEYHFTHGDYKTAEKYYQLASHKSLGNANQKGLAYLKLAELNFKNFGNYENAKLYYDSAASTLPKNFPGYETIVKKGQNLAYLTERYQLIAAQDTLQMMARLPQEARTRRIMEMFPDNMENGLSIQATLAPTQQLVMSQLNTSSKFYFANTSAVSRGFTDFRRRWGNRVLEDNWRQSVKSSAQVNQQNQVNEIGNRDGDTATEQTLQTSNRQAKIDQYIATLPATREQFLKSDQQIIDAYFEIGSFYQQVLEDGEEANKVDEILIARYPKNNHLDAIYYSLYLSYSDIDNTKALQFKQRILSEFPNSVYAKTLLDPNFSTRQNALDAAVAKVYHSVFDSYVQKDFSKVITMVNEARQRFPNNNLQAQFDYLKAISIGKTQPIDSLLIAFNKITEQHPDEKLISPLVIEHLAYIKAKLSKFRSRKIALLDFDPTETRFIAQRDSVILDGRSPALIDPSIPPQRLAETHPAVKIASPSPISITKTEVKLKQPNLGSIFTDAESNTYYYVISVSDKRVSLSSSRFGVGQFNRGNYTGAGLKHQLLEMDEDQLIFVGNFANLNDAKAYGAGIAPQLRKIMKVPAENYATFIISKENLEKIKNRETLQSYLEFFKNNF